MSCSRLHIYAIKFTISQRVLKISAISTHACFESCTPLVDGYVDVVLFNAEPKAGAAAINCADVTSL